MIPFTPNAVAKCFGTVVADINKIANSSVTAWFKSTFPDVTRIASLNPELFNPALANTNVTIIPIKPPQDRRSRTYIRDVDSYNIAISKIKVAFVIDLKAAMECAGYSPGQIQQTVAAFDKLIPVLRIGKF